jgi:signal transduction histidine kinase
MQAEIDNQEQRFRRFLLWFNLGWTLVSICSLFLSFVGVVGDHAEYFHDWRGLVIIILAACVPITFSLLFIRDWIGHNTSWPPPRSFSLTIWTILLSLVTVLCLFDNNFVWGYFTVLGITYSFFHRKWLFPPVLLIFLLYSSFLHVLQWPLLASDWSSLVGNGITFLSLTIVCITIQYLIHERFARQQLLEQITRTNAELKEAHRQLAESAIQEQELAVLRERTRLAREMHDTLGHALVLVAVKLEAAQKLREVNPARCDQELETTREIVRSSMKELRASIANLRSPALEREPACRALSRYAREMAQRNDLHIAYDLYPDIEGLPEPIEEALWKVGQEALANIEKHAQARNVLLHISRQDGQIFLKIEDDGIGLPPGLCQHQENAASYQSPNGHYGLNGMLERVKNVQGHLSIQSDSERGTAIAVTLPLVETPLVTSPA